MTQEQKELIRNTLTRLKNEGYVGVSLCFDGSGDDGSFNYSSVFRTDDGFDIDDDYSDGYNNDADELFSLGYEAADSTDHDWYNNDGGYGCVNICLLTGNIKVHMNIRVTDTNYYGFNYQAKEFTR